MKVAGGITLRQFLGVMSEKEIPPRPLWVGPCWEWELLGQVRSPSLNSGFAVWHGVAFGCDRCRSPSRCPERTPDRYSLWKCLLSPQFESPAGGVELA